MEYRNQLQLITVNFLSLSAVDWNGLVTVRGECRVREISRMIIRRSESERDFFAHRAKCNAIENM